MLTTHSIFMNKLITVFVLILISQYQISSAQSRSSHSSSNGSSLELNYSSELGGFYYQDPTGFEVAIDGIPYEGTIEKNSYILGASDLVNIEINSSQKLIYRGIVINSTGEIILPSIGSIHISGQTISDAENTLTSKLSETFKAPTVSISIELPKPSTIHVAGSIPYPGKYVVPAQSRVDIAVLQSILKVDIPVSRSNIYLPNYTSQLLTIDTYSFRNIEIFHANGNKSNADLVKYFRTGDLKSNPIVRSGDKIVISRRNRETPVVSISGAVSYGYELEFRTGDTIQDMVDISGGFEEDADSSIALLFRWKNDKIDKIEVQNEKWNSFKLAPNDRLVIPKTSADNLNSSITLKGEVVTPGMFPIISGSTTLGEILELAGGLSNNALSQAAYLLRGGNLENEIPNKFNTELMKRTSDQLIQGLEYLSLETSLSQNKVFVNLNDQNVLNNTVLFNGDLLFIPRNEQTIFVFGQVNNPGYFPLSPMENNKIFDFINKAGGYALSADKERVFVIKAGSSAWFKPEETTLESGDKIFIDRLPVEELNALRTFEVQKEQLKNTRIQLIMTGITTITGIITTYVAIRNIN